MRGEEGDEADATDVIEESVALRKFFSLLLLAVVPVNVEVGVSPAAVLAEVIVRLRKMRRKLRNG